MDTAPFGTGAVARTPDQRDINIGHAAPSSRPMVYMPDRSQIPVKMQGKYGTCGGHAGAAMESFLETLDLSPKYLWKQIKVGTDLTADVGTDMRTIFKTLQNVGVCTEALCPDVLDATFQEYSDAASLTDAQKNDGYPHGINNYAFIDNPTWEQLCQAIYDNRAVLALVDCGDGWWLDGWSEEATCPLRLGNYASGHFVVLWGYDEKYIYFRNSWSNAWGRNGDGYFDESYLPHVKEIGTGIDALSFKQQVIFKYQSLIKLLQDYIALLLKGRVTSQ